MTRSVLNLCDDVELEKQPMFFGEPLGLSRFDKIKYSIFEKLTIEQKKNYWSPEDINLSQDSIDYNTKLLPHMRHIFDMNLAYQTMMDSVTSRAILEAFKTVASLPEVEDCVHWWATFETIHNRSYQWIQQNLRSNPSEFFDTILKNTNIVSRAKSIVKHFDDFIEYTNLVRVFGYTDKLPEGVSDKQSYLNKKEHKRLAYRAMVAIYTLESIRFYVSFCCTFSMGQQELMMGNAAEMKLIARDEALHVGISLNILRLWPKDDPEFALIAKEEEEFVYFLFREVVEQEKEWALFVFSRGVLLGLNAESMGTYLEFLANKRLKALGLDQIFETKQNPFKWMSNWISSDKEQRAPQETEILDYKVAALNGTVNEDKLMVDF